jgi:hypothetical protein
VANRWYEFRPGVRDLLLQRSPIRTTTEVWREIGSFIEQNRDSLRDALGLVPNPSGSIDNADLAREHYFAEVKGAVLKTWGGEFAHQGQALIDAAQNYRTQKSSTTEVDELDSVFQELQEFPFTDAQLVDPGPDPPGPTRRFPPSLEPYDFTLLTVEQPLEAFEFTVATFHRQDLSQQQQQRRSQAAEWEIRRRTERAHRFIEQLPGDIPLEMVAIPAGTFLMGSPEEELERNAERESPQHEVTIQSFFMGRYPITQAQWKAVAELPQIERVLELDPSTFKGDTRPVERVTWDDAVEFCLPALRP